ncbi:MAG: hypothetical protein K2M10_08800 [Muribaculaceae bacterium]|nr:hypothetical protein [Muribaculaceae bacterium]
MKKNKHTGRRRILLTALLLPGAFGYFPLCAQLHEEINVQGKYVPEVIRIDRVNAFPKAADYTLPAVRLNYESGGVAAGFSPSLMPLPATGWNATRQTDTSRGYLEAGAGSWLNSTLSAGYRAIDTPATVLGVRLQHNSASLWKPHLSQATADVKQWRYDEALGVYASHLFDRLGRLDAAIDYHVGVFDYYGFMNPLASAGEKLNAPTQTLNDLSVKVDWTSAGRPDALSYYLSGRVRHFAFRSLPFPAGMNGESAKGNRETDLGFAGGVRMPWENGSSIGIDARLDLLFYAETPDRPDNYALGTLTPYYRFTRGLLDVKLGADIDLAVRAGNPGNRYSFFHVAPEVKFAIQSGGVGLWLNATGGSRLNTLASLHEYDYYMMPALATTTPTYTPLDASVGVNLGPFGGFSLGVEGGFSVSRHVPLGGWYQAWMNYDGAPLPAMGDVLPPQGGRMLYSLDTEGINLHGFRVGVRMAYEPVRFLSLKASGSYQPQSGEKGFFNGYDRPRIIAKAEATVRPLSNLSVTLGYDYRGVRTIYARMEENLPPVILNGEGQERLVGMRLPDLCLLNLSASWAFTPRFSVWVQADNLLNRRVEVLPCLPASGMVLTGGVKLLF